jgi:hypothetical protein
VAAKRKRRAFRALRARWKGYKALRRWERQGKPVPPPHIVKQLAVKKYAAAFGLRVLVETGTYHGEMVEAMYKVFDRLYSIEIDQGLYEEALDVFAPFPHIRIIKGDSGEVLPSILSEVKQPCLFWLDGHYSGPETGKGPLDTPITKELQHIFLHPVRDHVMLIDDARDFTGKGDYPSLDRLREFVRGFRPDWLFEVRDDIIRIYPRRPDGGRQTG